MARTATLCLTTTLRVADGTCSVVATSASRHPKLPGSIPAAACSSCESSHHGRTAAAHPQGSTALSAVIRFCSEPGSPGLPRSAIERAPVGLGGVWSFARPDGRSATAPFCNPGSAQCPQGGACAFWQPAWRLRRGHNLAACATQGLASPHGRAGASHPPPQAGPANVPDRCLRSLSCWQRFRLRRRLQSRTEGSIRSRRCLNRAGRRP